MLKILFASPAADLCGELLRQVELDSRFFLIVPRHYSHECERRLCEVLGDGASSYCEVLSVDRLYTRVATECGGTAEAFLDDAGRLLVAYSAAQLVATQMRVFGGELRKPEFLTEVLRLIDEMHTCCIDPQRLGEAAEQLGGELGDRLHDFALISESYGTELVRRGRLRDRADGLMSLLEGGWAADKTFAFFGYTEFTQQELELMRILLHSRKVTVALGCNRTLINPALGDEDPLYTYARTLERLIRLAESEGVAVEIEDIAEENDRPAVLRFIANEFLAGEDERFDGDASAVTMCQERSVWNECERAAAYILENVRREGMRFEDFAVALPEGGEYLGAVEAIFGSWGIPTFMDSTTPALEAPVISALSAAMDILRGGWAAEDVLRYIKSGLSDLSFKRCCELENYVYTWQISGRKWLCAFDRSPRGFSAEPNDGDAAALERLNDSRRRLTLPFQRFLERISMSDSYPAEELLRAFYDLLIELRLDRHIASAATAYAESGDLKTAGEYSQLWGKVCDLIDEFAELVGDQRMKFDEFSQLFELLLSGVQVGVIPPALDGVAVGEVGRLRHRRPKALLLLGARAGVFPPAPSSGGLLDDRDRETLAALELGFEPSSRKLAWRGIDTAYSALTLASRQLYISWSPSGDGGAAIPSPLVLRLGEVLGVEIQPPDDFHRLLHAENSALELALHAAGGRASGAQLAALQYFKDTHTHDNLIDRASDTAQGRRGPLSADAADALYGENTRINASRSDKFMGCAFSYFCQYGLRAKPRKRAELDAMESGTLIHFVLENTVRRANDEGLFAEEIGEAQKARALEIAHSELVSYIEERLGRAADGDVRTERLFTRLDQGLRQVVTSIMDEFAVSSFRPAGFEVDFGGEDTPLGTMPLGERGTLNGAIDRVDVWRDESGRSYFRVIDYKSGNKRFDYTDVFHGASLQLPIYLHALRRYAEENGIDIETAGAFYSPASEKVYSGARGDSDELVSREVEKLERRSGVYLEDAVVADAMEHGGGKRFLPSDSRFKLTRRKFALLDAHVQNKMSDVVRRITDGEIDASPSIRFNHSACDYCDFAAACKFDPTGGKDCECYRYSVKPDEFWEKLEEEASEDA